MDIFNLYFRLILNYSPFLLYHKLIDSVSCKTALTQMLIIIINYKNILYYCNN